MMAGIIAALIFPFIFSGLPLYNWPLLFLISIIGCIAGTYSAPATDGTILKKFYKQVRPWGFWKPVHELVVAEDPTFVPNKRFKLDMFNVVIGIIGQSCLTILPMYLILWMKLPLLITILIFGIVVLILKKTWWDKLEN
jgi:MFS family permease